MAIFRWPSSWDPFAGLRGLQRDLERIVGSAFGEGRRVGGGAYPPINVLSSENEIIVQCEVAGVKREDIDLSITGETLVIKGSKKPCADEETVRFHTQERGCGDFSRTIVLPDKVDAEKIEASLEAGILTIRLPKSEAAKPKRITVK